MEVNEEKENIDMENRDSQKKRKRKPKEFCGRTIGRPLAELFGVKINCGGYVYGTVSVYDGMIPQKIYDQESENTQAIGMAGEDNDNLLLLLSGPQDTFISVYDMLCIDVDLRHSDSSTTTRSEDNIKYQIGWYPNCHMNDFDKPLQELIEGDNGMTATLFFAVFSNAVQATVEVKLIENGGHNKGNSVRVYGLIAATNNMITDDDYVSVLFRKDSGSSVQVTPGNHIPLSRSIVAVPLNSNLTVCAALYTLEENSSDDTSKGIPYCLGKLTFRSKLSGTSQRNICGKSSKIQVKVDWSTDYRS